MDTKSETTKRIDELYWRTHNGCTMQKASKRQAHDKAIEAIATHLHQEVIRGKIEELACVSGRSCPLCDNVGWYVEADSNGEAEQVQCEFCYTTEDSVFNNCQKKIADLQRQIGEGK